MDIDWNKTVVPVFVLQLEDEYAELEVSHVTQPLLTVADVRGPDQNYDLCWRYSYLQGQG